MGKSHFTGKAGQFSVMAELSLRGYNVAIPEIDVGDDVFVLNDETGQLTRLQVKTATGKKLERTKSYACQFSIKVSHVRNAAAGGSHYVLAGRCGSRWRHLVMEKPILRHLMEQSSWGSDAANGCRIVSAVFFPDGNAKSSTKKNSIDLSSYVSNWKAWPIRE